MRKPNTADERERRIVEYLKCCHQGRLQEFQLTRMNRVANFRKRLMELINEMIEARAEDLAAGMLMQFAEPRPPKQIPAVEERLVIAPLARRMPRWLTTHRRAERH